MGVTPWQLTDQFTMDNFNNKITETNNYIDYNRVNLLDNWYFGNPVNQRGVSSGNGPENAYGIDRWKFVNAGTLNIDSDSIVIASDVHHYTLQQSIEQSKFAGAIGQTVTLSALIKGNGRLNIALGTTGGYGDWVASSDWTLVQMHGIVGSIGDYYIYVQARRGAGNLSVKAAKLELGSQQTLAHQDANGNWVLNEIPNYADTLARCQRYFQTFATESLRTTDALDFRPVMRANPALSTITVDGKTLYTASADL